MSMAEETSLHEAFGWCKGKENSHVWKWGDGNSGGGIPDGCVCQCGSVEYVKKTDSYKLVEELV